MNPRNTLLAAASVLAGATIAAALLMVPQTADAGPRATPSPSAGIGTAVHTPPLCDQETSTSGLTVTYGAGLPGCTAETVTYPQCAEEDGSGPQALPCSWGDGTIGVKHGLSYLVTSNPNAGPTGRCYVYVDPIVAADLNDCAE